MTVYPEITDPRIVPLSLGQSLRRMRDDRRISRERLAFNAGISASYVHHLETGARERPTKDVLTAVVRVLDQIRAIPAIQRRELLLLAGYCVDEPRSLDELRDAIAPDLSRTVAGYPDALVAYLDVYWNVLGCNEIYSDAFPGLRHDGNWLRWMLTDPLARSVLPDLDEEVATAVRILRGTLATPSHRGRGRQFLAEMSRYHEFRRLWNDGGVLYARDKQTLRLCDPCGGITRSVLVQHFGVSALARPDQVQVFLGLPVS
ncbi:helix-turn-helix domain-containing protein [Nocardia jejuensis]|uniref:helix-turn-helix domain-containing protein n=1 Tax=Nocardia jejuensis TaxID=328049 RepID=UPI0008337F18|nr:helix-turn-helix domain-containing protein [Nocardia jejuensis]